MRGTKNRGLTTAPFGNIKEMYGSNCAQSARDPSKSQQNQRLRHLMSQFATSTSASTRPSLGISASLNSDRQPFPGKPGRRWRSLLGNQPLPAIGLGKGNGGKLYLKANAPHTQDAIQAVTAQGIFINRRQRARLLSEGGVYSDRLVVSRAVARQGVRPALSTKERR